MAEVTAREQLRYRYSEQATWPEMSPCVGITLFTDRVIDANRGQIDYQTACDGLLNETYQLILPQQQLDSWHVQLNVQHSRIATSIVVCSRSPCEQKDLDRHLWLCQ